MTAQLLSTAPTCSNRAIFMPAKARRYVRFDQESDTAYLPIRNDRLEREVAIDHNAYRQLTLENLYDLSSPILGAHKGQPCVRVYFRRVSGSVPLFTLLADASLTSAARYLDGDPLNLRLDNLLISARPE